MAVRTIAAPEGKAQCVIDAYPSRAHVPAVHATVFTPEGSLPIFHMTGDTTHRPAKRSHEMSQTWLFALLIVVAIGLVLATPVTSPAIIAAVAPPSDSAAGWQSAVVFTNSAGQICSGTVVGPRTILTAATCIARDLTYSHEPSYVLIGDNRLYEILCTAHPAHLNNRSADFALCVANVPFSVTQIARINVDSRTLALGRTVLIAGYGCAQKDGVDRNLGRLRIGEAVITKLPDAGTSYAQLSGAAFCLGDAGGGTYVEQHLLDAQRTIVGVNSRSDLKQNSWAAATSTKVFIEWARDWSARTGGQVCGLSSTRACIPENVTTETRTASPPLTNSAQAASLASKHLWKLSRSDSPSVAQLTRVSVRANETWDQLIRRVCGAVGADYRSLLAQLSPDSAAPGALVKTSDDVTIPRCPPRAIRPAQREIVVQSGDTVWKYYWTVLHQHHDSGWRGFESSSAQMASSQNRYFLNVFKALNPGVNVDALEVGRRVQLPVYAAPPPDAPAVVATAAASIRPIFALQAAEGECKGDVASPNHPYSVTALLDILARNQSRDPRPRRPAHVMVADSGLFGARRGPFSETVLIKTTASWDQYAADIEPLNRGPEPAAHGTAVASLVLGGPLFARFQALSAPRVRLIVRRIYARYADGKNEWYGAVDQWFEQIIVGIRQYQAAVVNLSLKTDYEMYTLRENLDARSAALFVAAAGNGDGLLGPSNVIYPAIYGGRTAPNLVVVGALDGTGFATFSTL